MITLAEGKTQRIAPASPCKTVKKTEKPQIQSEGKLGMKPFFSTLISKEFG